MSLEAAKLGLLFPVNCHSHVSCHGASRLSQNTHVVGTHSVGLRGVSKETGTPAAHEQVALVMKGLQRCDNSLVGWDGVSGNGAQRVHQEFPLQSVSQSHTHTRTHARTHKQ